MYSIKVLYPTGLTSVLRDVSFPVAIFISLLSWGLLIPVDQGGLATFKNHFFHTFNSLSVLASMLLVPKVDNTTEYSTNIINYFKGLVQVPVPSSTLIWARLSRIANRPPSFRWPNNQTTWWKVLCKLSPRFSSRSACSLSFPRLQEWPRASWSDSVCLGSPPP